MGVRPAQSRRRPVVGEVNWLAAVVIVLIIAGVFVDWSNDHVARDVRIAAIERCANVENPTVCAENVRAIIKAAK